MKPFSMIMIILAHMLCSSVTVLAFSRIPQHSIVSPNQQLQSPLFRRKNARCNHSVKYKATPNNADADLSTTNNTNEVSTYYKYLLSQFQGDFDNYNQVVQDRRHDLTPGEGGGHENIHCTLVPCPQYDDAVDDDTETHQDQNQWILAAFYFNGNPRQIFRFRVYQLIPPPSEGLPVRMKLNTLMPNLEQQLRQCSDQPGIWWKEAWNVWSKENSMERSETFDAGEWNQLQTVGVSTMVSPLEGCDVLWDPNWDPSKHPYLYTDEYDDSPNNNEASMTDTPASSESKVTPGQSFHATMEAGSKGAIVDSIAMIPGKRILIKDELSLWKDEFWINDRGYDPDVVLEEESGEETYDGYGERMPFVYGNRRGVPYKLQRVSNFSSGDDTENVDINDVESSLKLERAISNSDLEWTLGEDFRTSDVFQNKMQAVDKTLE